MVFHFLFSSLPVVLEFSVYFGGPLYSNELPLLFHRSLSLTCSLNLRLNIH